MSQEQLADCMGTAQSTISKLERGDVNFHIDTLIRWAKALGLDVEITFLKWEREHELRDGTELQRDDHLAAG